MGLWGALAPRWSKAFAILFAVGAVSDTIRSFELGLLWPTFMRFAGRVIGLPFSLEGFAFFLGANFLGIYLYGWDRLSPRTHWLAGLPVAVLGAATAFFVVTANAWMNALGGFPVPGQDRTVVNVKVPGLLWPARLRQAERDDPRAGQLPQAGSPAGAAGGPSLLPGHGRDRYRLDGAGAVVLDRVATQRTDARGSPAAASAGGGRAAGVPRDRAGLDGPELGRQPWIVYGIIRTKDAVTSSPGLGAAFAGFTVIYLALATATAWLLRRLASGAPAALKAPRPRAVP